MDGLWDPPNYQETEDPVSFCFTYDIIEETGLNEKSCIQVLGILIDKADNDIIELEQELMDLVTQLACADEEFSDMFCTSLRVKSDFLDQSIRELKDEAHDFSLLSREPAESINDMLMSLFCCYLQNKDQQKFADNNTTVASSSYHKVHSDKQLNKQKGGSLNANHKGKNTSVVVTSSEKRIISKAKVKVEEPNADYHCTTPVSEYTSECRFRGSMLNTNINWNIVKIKSPIIKNDDQKNKTSRCKSISQKSKTKGNWNDQLKMVKSQPDNDENKDYTFNCLVESSQETNADQNISKELGFFHGNINTEDNQGPKTSISQSLCLVDPSPKPKTKQNSTNEPGFFHGNSDPEDNQEPKTSFSQSLCLVHPSLKPKPKQNGTKELGFYHGKSDPDHQELKTSLSQSLALVKSSQKPKEKPNMTKKLGFFHGNFNTDDHQEPKVSLSESLYSTKTYKRRKKLSSPWQTSSSSLILLEQPKPLAIIDVDVDMSKLHDMDYYTLEDLKVIARQRSLKGYSKLRKAELAQALGIKVTEGRRRLKSKDTLSSSKDKGLIDLAAGVFSGK